MWNLVIFPFQLFSQGSQFHRQSTGVNCKATLHIRLSPASNPQNSPALTILSILWIPALRKIAVEIISLLAWVTNHKWMISRNQNNRRENLQPITVPIIEISITYVPYVKKSNWKIYASRTTTSKSRVVSEIGNKNQHQLLKLAK